MCCIWVNQVSRDQPRYAGGPEHQAGQTAQYARRSAERTIALQAVIGHAGHPRAVPEHGVLRLAVIRPCAQITHVTGGCRSHMPSQFCCSSSILRRRMPGSTPQATCYRGHSQLSGSLQGRYAVQHFALSAAWAARLQYAGLAVAHP